jgi:hypothetical protein
MDALNYLLYAEHYCGHLLKDAAYYQAPLCKETVVSQMASSSSYAVTKNMTFNYLVTTKLTNKDVMKLGTH